MATTILELMGQVNRILCGLSSSSALTDQLKVDIKWALHRQLQAMSAEYQHAAFRQESFLSMIPNQEEYLLAADIDHLIATSVRYMTEGQEFPMTYIGADRWDQSLGSVRFRSATQPALFTVLSKDKVSGRWRIRVFPTPTEAHQIRYAYWGLPLNIKDASDTAVLDPRFDESLIQILVDGAALMFPEQLSRDQLFLVNRRKMEAMQTLGRYSLPAVGVMDQRDRYRGGLSRTHGHVDVLHSPVSGAGLDLPG